MTENAFESAIANAPEVAETPEVAAPEVTSRLPLVFDAVAQATAALNGDEYNEDALWTLLGDATGRDGLLMWALTQSEQTTLEALGEAPLTGAVDRGLDAMLASDEEPNYLIEGGLKFFLDFIVEGESIREQSHEVKGNTAGLIAAFAFVANNEEALNRAVATGAGYENRLAFLVGAAASRGIRPGWVSKN